MGDMAKANKDYQRVWVSRMLLRILRDRAGEHIPSARIVDDAMQYLVNFGKKHPTYIARRKRVTKQCD